MRTIENKSICGVVKLNIFSIETDIGNYPTFSHYVHCAGNPLSYIDPDGRKIVAVYDGISYTYRREGDEYAFYDRDGNSYMGDDPFMTSLTSALKEIGAGNHGSSLLDYLANHENTVEIKESKRGNGAYTDSPYEILLNISDYTDGGYCEMGYGYTTERPPFIGLAHEMAHIQDKWKGTMDNSMWYVMSNGLVVDNSEKHAIHIENLIRSEHYYPLRTHYSHSFDHNMRAIPNGRIVWGNVNMYNNTIYRLPLFLRID